MPRLYAKPLVLLLAAIVVTTGVRGFSEEDLANAKPNAAEVEKMKSFAATNEEAAELAESGKLAAKPVAYFDERGKPLKEKK